MSVTEIRVGDLVVEERSFDRADQVAPKSIAQRLSLVPTCKAEMSLILVVTRSFLRCSAHLF